MFFQLWSNGEVTMTKGGEFFSLRSLFVQAIALRKKSIIDMPHQYSHEYSYALLPLERSLYFRRLLMIILFGNDQEDVPEHFSLICSSIEDAIDGKCRYKFI